MSEYLSKEEIKQWRSSLEKITLEEYAARLGKKIEEEKPTNDLIDIVLKGQPVMSSEDTWNKGERLSNIAQRSFEREQEISISPFSISKLRIDSGVEPSNKKISIKSLKTNKSVKKTLVKPEKKNVKTADIQVQTKAAKLVKPKVEASDLREEVRIVFKKALTNREQKVFDYFAQNKNHIVYAKDLAGILDLPRDYVYKYIKNLRAKIEGDKLANADKGGFILHI